MPDENKDIEIWVARRLQFLGLISGTSGEDFRAEDLSGQDLRSKDFAGANLRLTNLAKADLRGADLSFATLHMADLTKSDLRGAKLVGADLLDAKLPSAKLEGADLTAARLTEADLSRADLKGALLGRAELIKCNLQGASLAGTYIHSSDAREANFRSARILGSNLCWSQFARADIRSAIVRTSGLVGADLSDADFSGADLTDSDLIHCSMVNTVLDGTILNGARVFGASVWSIHGKPHEQTGLVVTAPEEAPILVDDIEVAQFIYLLLNNKKIRSVIDTVTSKVVLILGRFTPERMDILNAIRQELRKRNYVPVLFDFEKPTTRDLTETVTTLALMAMFVIADLTDAKSLPQELSHIVPQLPSVPVQPLVLASQPEYRLFEHFRRYPWVLEAVIYENKEELLGHLEQKVIAPAEAKAREQKPPK